MAAVLGRFQFDSFNGPPPPAVKASVDLIFRPGQATAAAKILPAGTQPGSFDAVAYAAWPGAHALADLYRQVIGTPQTMYYGGVLYGNLLVMDVTVLELAALIRAAGVHADGSQYDYTPAGRITSRWSVVRLV